MKEKSRISIVLVTKYAHRFLELCLKSYEKNSLLDNELIIVCDQPSWQTLKLLQEKGMKYWLTNYNHFFMACNFGANIATREYVGFLNDDVYLGPGWDAAVEEIVAPDVLACVTNINSIGGSNFGYDRAMRNLENFDTGAFEKYCIDNRSEKIDSYFWMPLVIERETFFNFGGFTYYNHHAHGHEIQLENRIKRAGARVKTSNKGFLYHFGNVGNHDRMPESNQIFYAGGFFGCSLCGNITPNESNTDSGPVVEFIQKNGYWLCHECRGKTKEIDVTSLRRLHATRFLV